MVLIDAGCEYKSVVSENSSRGCYNNVSLQLLTLSCDSAVMHLISVRSIVYLVIRQSNRLVARTYPATGKFTPAQAALYQAVLQAQKYLVTLCTESARLSLAQIHRESCEALRKELNQIGFNLNGIAGGDLDLLYPHYVGHPLGIGLLFLRLFGAMLTLLLVADLHESTYFERNDPSVWAFNIIDSAYLTFRTGLWLVWSLRSNQVSMCPLLRCSQRSSITWASG